MKKILLFCLLLFLVPNQVFSFWGRRSFATLSDLQKYARQVPENPKIDNEDYERPDYTSFYHSGRSGFLSQVWRGVKNFWTGGKRKNWDPGVLERLLVSVTADQKKHGGKGDFVEKLTLKSGARFVVWGNLHGSYHSLVRALTYLHDVGVIDKQLKIVKPEYSFLFDGNAISLTPYSMETLSTVLLLMKQNPQAVFYVRGTHESDRNWFKHGFKEELEAKLRKTKNFVRFEVLLDKFFKRLPLALYIRKRSGALSQFVQLSHAYVPFNFVDKEFLYKPQARLIETCQLSNKRLISRDNTFCPVDLCVSGDIDRCAHVGLKGLQKTACPQGRCPSWSVCSAQNKVYQESKKHFHDSFVILSLHDSLYKSTLSLFTRDVREKDNFVKETYLAFPSSSDKKALKFNLIRRCDDEMLRLRRQVEALRQEKERLSTASRLDA